MRCRRWHVRPGGSGSARFLVASAGCLAWLPLVSAGILEECFDGSLFPPGLCCDTSLGAKGFDRCWDEVFTFERCCSVVPVPVCSQQLVDEVWDHLRPDSPHSFREFWRSEAFYAIRRAHGGSINCTMAYVASRALAFTKLPWEAQWEILHDPHQATRSSNFQVPAIVHVLRGIVGDWSLWTLLDSPPWSSFILQRLYSHRKKIWYAFLSDYRPILQNALPVSDKQNSAQDSAFRMMLLRRLKRRLALPAAEAAAYLATEGAARFGLITAHLVLAVDTLADKVPRPAASHASVAAAQELLRAWALVHEYGDLFFTQWPILRLLALLARMLESPQAAAESQPWWPLAVPEVRTLVLACGGLDVQLPAEYGWSLRQFQAEPDACVRSYAEAVRAEASQHSWVLMLSPWSWEWTAEHAAGVRDILASLADDDARTAAVGFPAVDRNGAFNWPPRRLAESKRTLRYEVYPTGYPAAKGLCAISDTTSGTRAYRPEAILALLGEGEPDSAASFLVELDLVSWRKHEPNRAAWTCMVSAPLHEDDYLSFATLSDRLFLRHRIERASFSPRRQLTNCGSGAAVLAREVEGESTPQALLPPCAASDLASLLAAVASWRPEAALECLGRAGCESGGVVRLPGREAALLEVGALGSVCADLRASEPSLRSCESMLDGSLKACGSHGEGCLVVLHGVPEGHEAKARVAVPGLPVRVLAGEPERGLAAQTAAGERVLLLYCGPRELRLQRRPGWSLRAEMRPVSECASVWRGASAQIAEHSWTVLLSPYLLDWGQAQADAVDVAIAWMRLNRRSIAGFPVIDSNETWRWPCAKVRHRFWKLEYGEHAARLPGDAKGCEAADTTSGTRVYESAELHKLLLDTSAEDPATLLVELDILALQQGHGRAWTCPWQPVHEESFLEWAALPPAFAERHQVEVARFTAGNERVHCLGTSDLSPWALAHQHSDQRLATRFCYRKAMEEQFCRIVAWWRALDPERHFASPKQGTLLTGMIRGGQVSTMPWDDDLELSLYSTEGNMVLTWCTWVSEWKARADCIAEKLEAELGMRTRPNEADLLPRWLFEEHLVMPKFKVEVEGIFDVNFEGWVPLMPIVLTMFGQAEVRVTWEKWEYQFFEVFSTGWVKKVGQHGNNVAGADTCASAHNACIPACEEHADADGRLCIIEFDDHFAHTRDPSMVVL